MPNAVRASDIFFFLRLQKTGMDSAVASFQEEKLRKLAENPRNSVYKTHFDTVNEPWPVARVHAVIETIAKRVAQFPTSTPDFTVRKTCLDDPEILAFHKRHPQLYAMVTDRDHMKNPKYRATVSALLELRRRVEKGEISEGNEADGAATRVVIDALS